jgi:DNA repair exonuclease SbcCD ATPase subunit
LGLTEHPAVLATVLVQWRERRLLERESALALKQVQQSLEAAQVRLSAASVQHSARAKKLNWGNKCYRMRSALDYDELPAKVVRHNLARVVAPINRHLELLDAPYRAVAEEDCSFSIVKDSGEKHPACRLSDGELLILSVSMILAMVDVYAGRLGFVVLDEPTAMLDRANVRGFVKLLERVQKLFRDRGAQIILVTHEPELARSADHIIDLGAS